MCHEDYFAGRLGDMEDDYGFVFFPKPNEEASYKWSPTDNVWCIPACYDADRAWKIAFAFNLFTEPTPGYEDSDNWKSGFYSKYRDDRAVDETIAMMRDTSTQFTWYTDMIPGYDLGSQYLWSVYGINPSATPAEKAEEMRATWQAYIDEAAKKSEIDRTDATKTKTGCPLKGVYAINPVNGKEVPVFIGDFVLGNYGTGAVMAVPSHDQRDFEYAVAHKIPMIQVIEGRDVSECAFEKQDYLGKGCKLINSEEFTGLTVEEAKEAITVKLEAAGVARRKNNYHFREWIFARQRYWGEPVPCVYTEEGETVFLPDSELPLILPELEDYKGKGGKAPLENAEEWKHYDQNGIKGLRETSTMPGSAGSSWYFMRYIDPKNDKALCDPELLKHWLPVDLYIGGPEHAVGHLMYSRIWNRFLYDEGISPVKEPFKKLVHQGMILGENGIKMGKRFPKYVVNPSDIVRDYGADTLRLYEMFMGPLEVSKPWSPAGVEGAHKFIKRVWSFFSEPEKITDTDDGKLTKIYHKTVKKVTSDFETLGFNTAIAQMMVFVNDVYKNGTCPREYAEGFIKMLSCITPHVGEELWQLLGHDKTIAYEPWPVYDEAKCKDTEVTIAVQVNGKMRGTVMMDADLDNDTVIANVLANEKIAAFLAKQEGQIRKTIVVKNKLVNLIVK